MLEELRRAFTRVPVTGIDPASMVISDQFTRQQARSGSGLRRPEAVDAMRRADAVDSWDVGEGTTVHLVASSGTSMGRPHRVLLEVIEPDGHPPSLTHGWRIPGAGDDSPTELFVDVVHRQGVVVELGDRRGRFIATAESPNGPADLKVPVAARDVSVVALVRRIPKGASWAWVHAVALGADDQQPVATTSSTG